jgi:hypothetical protein
MASLTVVALSVLSSRVGEAASDALWLAPSRDGAQLPAHHQINRGMFWQEETLGGTCDCVGQGNCSTGGPWAEAAPVGHCADWGPAASSRSVPIDSSDGVLL